MKRWLVLFLIAVMSVSLLLVIAEDGNPLIGSWNLTYLVSGDTSIDLTGEYSAYIAVRFTFSEDCSFNMAESMFGQTELVEGTYAITGTDSLVFYMDGMKDQTSDADFLFGGDILVIIEEEADGNLTKMFFKRITEESSLLDTIREKGKIVIAMEGNWIPWTYQDEITGELIGFDYEVGNAIAAKLGVEAQFEICPWDNIFTGIGNRYDICINGVDWSAERAENYTLSNPYVYNYPVLIVRSDSDIQSFEDLNGKTTANTASSTYAALAESYGATNYPVDDLNSTLQLLIDNRIQATVNSADTFKEYMENNPDVPLKIAATAKTANSVVIVMPKGESAKLLADEINKAIEELKKDGTLAKLSIKYFGIDMTLSSSDTAENPIATITMENGEKIVLELYPDKAPNTVANFVELANSGFYDGVIFHRIIEGLIIQGGDPQGTGYGGPGYAIKGEFAKNGFIQNDISHERGVISMARSNAYDSAGSQFFIVLRDYPTWDGAYAAFERVIQGMETVDALASVKTNLSNNRPLNPPVIKSIRVDTKGVKYETQKNK